MFSRLGPLFKSTFRKTEETDTRQAIRIDEKKQGGKKKEEEEKPKTPEEMWEDSTTVSVEALRVFLEDFLKNMQNQSDNAQDNNTGKNSTQSPAQRQHAEETTKNQPQDKPQNTQDTRAKKAINAYQNTYSYSHPQPSTPPHIERDKPGPAILESSEIRQIYELIKGLEQLSVQGVAQLNILKEGTFLESIALAVERAKK